MWAPHRGRRRQGRSAAIAYGASVSEGFPFITFLSDYGLDDEFVGICHGVIARRCPQARVIDLTHGIPACDVLIGAIVLRDAVDFIPAGVHLAVVDPGVGATGEQARRAVALRTREQDRLLVGPDNGLLMQAADRLGGVVEAVDIGASPERLQPVSATFHGRDVFAPVAAALADGAPLRALGEPLDQALLHRIELPSARVAGQVLHAHVRSIDRFGNVALDAHAAQLEKIGVPIGTPASIEPVSASHRPAGYIGGTSASTAGAPAEAGNERPASAIRGRAFADVPAGRLLLYVDARGMLALAVNGGSAANALRLRAGDEVEVQGI